MEGQGSTQGPGTPLTSLGFVATHGREATMPPPTGKSQTFPMCHAFTHLWFIASFTDKEAKAQRCSVPCLRSHSCYRWRWGSNTKCPVLPCVPFLCWVLGLSWWDISPAPITPLSGSISLSSCLTWRMA